jgi:hypothetical protein
VDIVTSPPIASAINDIDFPSRIPQKLACHSDQLICASQPRPLPYTRRSTGFGCGGHRLCAHIVRHFA